MTAMDVMNQCRLKKLQILRLEGLIEELKDIMKSCAGGYVVVRNDNHTPEDKMSAWMSKKDELELQLQKAYDEWSSGVLAVTLLVIDLPTLSRKSMQAFYIHGKSIELIATELSRCSRSIIKALTAGRKAMAETPEDVVEAVLRDSGWIGGNDSSVD